MPTSNMQNIEGVAKTYACRNSCNNHHCNTITIQLVWHHSNSDNHFQFSYRTFCWGGGGTTHVYISTRAQGSRGSAFPENFERCNLEHSGLDLQRLISSLKFTCSEMHNIHIFSILKLGRGALPPLFMKLYSSR